MSRASSPYREVLPCQAARQLAAYRVVDVREPEEFHGDLGHLPGAALAPLSSLSGAPPWPRTEALLIVCRSGRRSREACARLAQHGFTDITNLSGGILDWGTRGLPLCGRRHPGQRCCEAPRAEALEETC